MLKALPNLTQQYVFYTSTVIDFNFTFLVLFLFYFSFQLDNLHDYILCCSDLFFLCFIYLPYFCKSKPNGQYWKVIVYCMEVRGEKDLNHL